MPHHQAILVNHPGGPETLTYTQIATPRRCLTQPMCTEQDPRHNRRMS